MTWHSKTNIEVIIGHKNIFDKHNCKQKTVNVANSNKFSLKIETNSNLLRPFTGILQGLGIKVKQKKPKVTDK